MKKKLICFAFLIFLGAIWLFPFRFPPYGIVMLVGALAAYACLLLIPRAAAAVAAAFAVSLGFSLYNGAFFAYFAPGLAACAVFFVALRSDDAVSPKKDGLFLTASLIAASCDAGGFAYFFAALKGSGLQTPTMQRHLLFVAAAFGLFIMLLFVLLRERKTAGRKKTPSYCGVKQCASFSFMLIADVISVLLYLRFGEAESWSFAGVFLCSFTVLCVRNPAVDALFRRDSSD